MNRIVPLFVACVLAAAGIVAAATPAVAQTANSPATAGRASARLLAQSRAPRGFSVSLVQGDLKGGSASDVPAPAAKALADLKDFLPYKAYRLLDTQWTVGAGRMSARLRGPDGKSYQVELNAQPAVVPGLNGPNRGGLDSFRTDAIAISRFVLRDESDAVLDAARVRALYDKGLINETQYRKMQEDASLSPLHPDMIASSGRPLIDTSFRMEIGETVVVGTSSLQGDTALIVLLTAVGATDAARGSR